MVVRPKAAPVYKFRFYDNAFLQIQLIGNDRGCSGELWNGRTAQRRVCPLRRPVVQGSVPSFKGLSPLSHKGLSPRSRVCPLCHTFICRSNRASCIKRQDLCRFAGGMASFLTGLQDWTGFTRVGNRQILWASLARATLYAAASKWRDLLVGRGLWTRRLGGSRTPLPCREEIPPRDAAPQAHPIDACKRNH